MLSLKNKGVWVKVSSGSNEWYGLQYCNLFQSDKKWLLSHVENNNNKMNETCVLLSANF